MVNKCCIQLSQWKIFALKLFHKRFQVNNLKVKGYTADSVCMCVYRFSRWLALREIILSSIPLHVPHSVVVLCGPYQHTSKVQSEFTFFCLFSCYPPSFSTASCPSASEVGSSSFRLSCVAFQTSMWLHVSRILTAELLHTHRLDMAHPSTTRK